MANGFVRYILFLIAYIPVYLIAALKSINDALTDDKGVPYSTNQIISNNWMPISLLIVSIVLILYFIFYSHFALKPKGTPLFTIKKITQQRKEYITYLGTYILPFIGLQASNIFDVMAVVLMFLTIGFIYCKTNLIYTNPTLVLFGFDIFEVETNDGYVYDCISKYAFNVGDKPTGRKIAENTLILEK